MPTTDRLSPYLKSFCSEQNWHNYTARDHASWRYIMKRGLPFYKKHAVHVYENGVHQTGLPLDRIPSIEFMDESLQKFGWGAVPICGFIPTFAFIEFQANKVLPIASDMRTMDHIGYTPAPDIVHEAAGHAPILPDTEYADFLVEYGKMALRALYSKEDLLTFEAVRALSDIKEKPGAEPAQILELEKALNNTIAQCTYVSEQAKAARLSWWTNEYGLVGDLKDPKIFGAGLLSSVTEAKAIYESQVKKIRLTKACLDKSYDITKPQPQLYVAEDMQHLIDVAKEFDQSLSYHIGGSKAIKNAYECRAVSTTILSNNLEISGKIAEFETTPEDEVCFIKWEGPVQLCHQRIELKNQGIKRHPNGFSFPLGSFDGVGTDPSTLNDHQLEQLGIIKEKRVSLKLTTGFLIEGKLLDIEREPQGSQQRILLFTFLDCHVTKNGKTYFQPDWGLFDFPVALACKTVFGGPSDRHHYGEQELLEIQTHPGREAPYTKEEKEAFSLYQKIRDLRESHGKPKDYDEIGYKLLKDHPQEWLGLLEVYEKSPQPQISDHLTKKGLYSKPIQDLIIEGLETI